MSTEPGLGRLRARFGCWPVVIAIGLAVIGLAAALPNARAAGAAAEILALGGDSAR